MAVSGNSIAIKSFQSFQVNEGLLQKVVEAVKEGEKQASSSGEVRSLEVFYHGFRQNIRIGCLYIVPASVCDSPEDFPVALLYGTAVRLLNLGEEMADLVSLRTGSEFDETTDVEGHLKALKEQAFTVDGKLTSLVVFAPAWGGIREYVCFQYTDDDAKLTDLLRHLVFACYFNPAVSSGFDALMTTVDTWKFDVTDITPKLTYPTATESPFRAYPELMKAAARRDRVFLTARTADAIAKEQLEPSEMNVFESLGEALGKALKHDTKSPAEAAEKEYKKPDASAEVPRADDGTGPKTAGDKPLYCNTCGEYRAARGDGSCPSCGQALSKKETKQREKEHKKEVKQQEKAEKKAAGRCADCGCGGARLCLKCRRAQCEKCYTACKAAADLRPHAMPSTPMTEEEMGRQQEYVSGMSEGMEALDEHANYPDPASPESSPEHQALVHAPKGESYVVKQDNQIVHGPCTMEECLDHIMEKQGEGIGLSRGGWEVEPAGKQAGAAAKYKCLNCLKEHGSPVKCPACGSSEKKRVEAEYPKTADTADNPANERGGEGAMDPKTDQEKRNTRGEEPELAPDKNASLSKVAYVSFCKGHKDSRGELAEWCIKSHGTGKILSSHKSEEAARKHLQDMHAHSGSVHKEARQEWCWNCHRSVTPVGSTVGNFWSCPQCGKKLENSRFPREGSGKVAGTWAAIDPECPEARKLSVASVYDQHIDGCPRCRAYNRQFVAAALKMGYGVHPADCTCGWCEHKGDIAEDGKGEKKDASAKTAKWVLRIADESGRGYSLLEEFATEDEARKYLYDRCLPALVDKFGEDNEEIRRMVEEEDRDGIIEMYFEGEPESYTLDYVPDQGRGPGHRASGKTADTADNPASEKGGEGAIHPKTDAEKPKTAGPSWVFNYRHSPETGSMVCKHCNKEFLDPKFHSPDMYASYYDERLLRHLMEAHPETVPQARGKSAPRTAGLSHGEFYAPDVHEVVGEWLGLGRKHALRKTSDIQMTCPWCKAAGRQPGIAHKQHPEDKFHCPQCGWSSGKQASAEEGMRKTASSRTAGYHDVTKAEDALKALEGFFSGYSETDPKDDIKHAFDALEGSESPALEDIRTDLERAYNMDDFSEAADAVDRVQLELETVVETGGHGSLPQEEVAEEIAAPPAGSMGVAASERSREAARRKEAWLRRNRQSSVREFGDIFAEAMARFRTAAPVQPEVAQAKAESEAPPAKVPETTDPCALADQKGGEDAGGVPRLATEHGDINISISLDGGTSKVKSKLPLGDGPKEKKDDKKEKKDKKADDRRIGCGCSLCKTAHPACTGYRHEAGPCNCEKVRAAQPAPKKAEGIQKDLSGAREKLEHGAKECLSNSPESVQTKDPIELAKQAVITNPIDRKCPKCGGKLLVAGKGSRRNQFCCGSCGKNFLVTKKGDQSVAPDVEEARRGVEGKSKAELAGTPEATQTTDPLDLGKQACAPVGDDLDEAVDMEIGLGDLADLGANLPPVAWGEKETPQVGEGGLNSEPKEKKAASLIRAAGDAAEGLLGLDPGGDRR